MKKLIFMLALAGTCYGEVYATVPVQKHDTTRMREKKPAKTKIKKPVKKDTVKDTTIKV